MAESDVFECESCLKMHNFPVLFYTREDTKMGLIYAFCLCYTCYHYYIWSETEPDWPPYMDDTKIPNDHIGKRVKENS